MARADSDKSAEKEPDSVQTAGKNRKKWTDLQVRPAAAGGRSLLPVTSQSLPSVWHDSAPSKGDSVSYRL